MYEVNPETTHPIPTDLPEIEGVQARKKVAKDNIKFPYINNSGIDVAGKVLRHLYPSLKERDLDWKSKGSLVKFDQLEFSAPNSSMNDYGYIFIPS